MQLSLSPLRQHIHLSGQVGSIRRSMDQFSLSITYHTIITRTSRLGCLESTRKSFRSPNWWRASRLCQRSFNSFSCNAGRWAIRCQLRRIRWSSWWTSSSVGDSDRQVRSASSLQMVEHVQVSTVLQMLASSEKALSNMCRKKECWLLICDVVWHSMLLLFCFINSQTSYSTFWGGRVSGSENSSTSSTAVSWKYGEIWWLD